MSDQPKLKRPECDGCEWWTVVTGEFMSYEMPESLFAAATDALTGETVQVRKMAPLEIHVPKVEIRAWCSYPLRGWDLCKLDQKPSVVKCDECPLLSDDKGSCHLNGAEVVYDEDQYVARLTDCSLLVIQTFKGRFMPVVRTI